MGCSNVSRHNQLPPSKNKYSLSFNCTPQANADTQAVRIKICLPQLWVGGEVESQENHLRSNMMDLLFLHF